MRIRAMKKQSQNKANLLEAQMNVTSFITKYYENKWQRRVRKNKPNSNPIPQPPFLPQKPQPPTLPFYRLPV